MSLKDKALQFLQHSTSPRSTFEVSSGIGYFKTQELDLTLHSLERDGIVNRLVRGKLVLWQCAAKGDAVRNTLGESHNANVMERPLHHQSSNETGGIEPSVKHMKTSEGNASATYDSSNHDVEMEPLQEEEGPAIQKHPWDHSFGKRHHDSNAQHDTYAHSASSIPRPPHEIVKPVGPRTTVIANIYYGQSNDYGYRPQSHYQRENMNPSLSHHSLTYGRQSGIQGKDCAPYGEPPQVEIELVGDKSHRNANEREEEISIKILAFMKQFNRPVATLEIAKGVNRKTKKDVNPTLYDMERKGIIIKTCMQPPAWNLASSVPETSGHQVPNNFPRHSPHTSHRRHVENEWCKQGYHPVECQPSGQQNEEPSGQGSNVGVAPRLSQPDGRARQFSWAEEEETSPPQQFLESTLQQGGQDFTSHSVKQRQDERPRELSSLTFSALHKNPVSALNEYAQKNQIPFSYELLHERSGGPRRFLVAVQLDGKMYNAVSAANMKDARKEAADVALREILSRQENVALPPQMESKEGWTHFDRIAKLSHSAFATHAAEVQEKFAGRKVIAAIVKKRYSADGEVVSIGTGNRCLTGDRLSLNGTTVNDSHAEIICRRAFLKYLYAELGNYYSRKESIFTSGGQGGKLQVKDDLTWHLYISTAPCGDGALFSDRDSTTIDPGGVSTTSRDHVPLYTSRQQGVLRTKVEDGEGTIPIDANEGTQTWDGIKRGCRLRTMSCSDKIIKWNVLGMQGALLSHVIEPIYFDSLTIGYLYEHGHLARAMCCRLDKESAINGFLPMPYSLNHPSLGRVTVYDPPRGTEKTNNLSVNWFLGSSGIEVTDGRTGSCLSRTGFAPTPSRLCKAAMLKQFKLICSKDERLKRLLTFETYREMKEKALRFQEAKAVMNKQFKNSGFGVWIKKPRELEMFDI